MSAASVTSSAPAPSGSSACASQSFSEFPTKDAACAVGGTSGVPDNYHDILESCCKDASVESWNNGCALWCLAADQSISDLQKCWQDGGVQAGGIFCNQANNATATSKPSSTSGGDDTKETGSAASSSGTPGSSSTPGAAHAVTVPQGVSKAGLGMLAMVLGSAVFGALL